MSVRTIPGALDILNQKLGGNAGDIPASSTKEYALEKIYRTLGGEETLEGVNTTSEIIEKIADVAEGGGGSSDFSTAEVTAKSVTADDPHYGPTEFPESINFASISVNKLSTETIFESEADVKTVVLYRGEQRNMLSIETGVIRVEGDAVLEPNASDPRKTDLKIYGDCTLIFGYRK